MKKMSLIFGICVALAGCSTMDTNLESAQETRDANRDSFRQEFGCGPADEHAAYRNCLLNTYYANKPKTFSTYVNKDGQSVAVIKNETKESYDADTNTYKTERVIVIETEERLVPAPVATPVPEEPKEEPVVETEETISEEIISEEIPTKEEIAPVEPTPQKTWWDTYQEEKEVEETDEPVCPCDDPNDPCPQCVDK